MEYLDFNLYVGSHPRNGGDPERDGEPPAHEYAVYATSREGETRGSFTIPFSPEELERLPAAFCPWAEEALGPVEVGDRLFKALLGGEVGRLFASCVSRLEPGQERLRVALHLAPEQALLALPWELLRDSATGDRLALRRQISLVRCLDVRRPPTEAKLPARLGVLVVSSGKEPPSLALDEEPLALEDERRHLVAALGRIPGATVETLDPPRLDALRERLREDSVHVFHYMGHGQFRNEDHQGCIQLETADGEIDKVSGHDLATSFGDVADLRLVVLNACRSARDDGMTARQPFAGVATALVQAGLPAVVAMQGAISDQAALAFSRAFYERLAAGDPVETALVEGRQAIFSLSEELRNEAEWAMPVLYRRAAGGDLVLTSPEQRSSPWRRLAAALVGLAALGALLVALLRPWLGASRPVENAAVHAGSTASSLLGEVPGKEPPTSRAVPPTLLLSEICANPEGDDDEHEWIELVNLGSEPIDLAGYSLAGGGDGYTWSFPLSGIVEPRSTFVLGGPYSDKSNANPRFDDPRNLYSRLQNGVPEADVVALFDVPNAQRNAETVPIDVVIYGGANSNNLVDETGKVASPDVDSPQEGASIVRLDRAGRWALSSDPTPNASLLLEEPPE